MRNVSIIHSTNDNLIRFQLCVLLILGKTNPEVFLNLLKQWDAPPLKQCQLIYIAAVDTQLDFECINSIERKLSEKIKHLKLKE